MIDLSRTIEDLIDVVRTLEDEASVLPDDLYYELDKKTDEPILELVTTVELTAADEVRRLVQLLLALLYEDRVSLDMAAL